MRYLILPLFAFGLLITIGCRVRQPQEQFEGTWIHVIPWINGQERTLILRGIRDNEGKLVFEFLKQHYSYRPLFTGYSFEKDKIKINFTLVAYYGDYDSGHRLEYILRKEKNVLRGQLLQSWKEPVEVALSKLNEEDAIKTLEALAKEIDSRKAMMGERFKTYNKAKRELEGSIKKLEAQLSKSRAKVQELEAKLAAGKEDATGNMPEK